MSPSRKKMVDARIISDKEYVNQWSAKIYSGKDFAEGQAEIYTEKKERAGGLTYKSRTRSALLGLGFSERNRKAFRRKE